MFISSDDPSVNDKLGDASRTDNNTGRRVDISAEEREEPEKVIGSLDRDVLQSHVRVRIRRELSRRGVIACQGRQEIGLRGEAQVHACRTAAI